MPQQTGGSRKRSYYETGGDVDMQNGREPSFQGGGGRAFKQPRRGGFGGRGGFQQQQQQQQQQGVLASNNSFAQQHQLPLPPPPPRGLPPFDPNSNPMDVLFQLQQQMGLPHMPMPEFSRAAYSAGPRDGPPRRRKQRCWDFDNKGICTRSNCMFEHIPAADPAAPSDGECLLPGHA